MRKKIITTHLKNLRVLFFGTPEFSIPTLAMLLQQTQLLACVTQPDAPSGRGKKHTQSPVKQWSVHHDIPVLQPVSVSLKTHEGKNFYEQCKKMKPDIAIVVAYGNIIPSPLLSLPQFGFLNIHPSLLPKFRGPSPVPSAILAGENNSGVTIIKLDEGMDTGPILTQKIIPIAHDETTATLMKKCFTYGAKILFDILSRYIHGERLLTPQNDRFATITRMMNKNDGRITWTESPVLCDRKIRALNPWPGVYTICKGKRIKILAATLKSPAQLLITKVQPEGKTAMSYDDFARGYQCVFPPRST